MAEKNSRVKLSAQEESDLKKIYFGKILRTFSEKSNRPLAFENTFFLICYCNVLSSLRQPGITQSSLT